MTDLPFSQSRAAKHEKLLRLTVCALILILPLAALAWIVNAPPNRVVVVNQQQIDVSADRLAVLNAGSDQKRIVHCVQKLAEAGTPSADCAHMFPQAGNRIAKTQSWARLCDLWYVRDFVQLSVTWPQTTLRQLDQKLRCAPQFIAEIQTYDKTVARTLYRAQHPQGWLLSDILNMDEITEFQAKDVLRLVSLSHKARDGSLDQRLLLFKTYGGSGHLIWHSGPPDIRWGYVPR